MGAGSVALRWVQGMFGLDVRSMALWRVAAALLLLADVAWRARDAYALLSDSGVWPAAHATRWNPHIVSLHFVSGTHAFQALILAISVACSLCLLVGYRTRLASFLSWVLLTSLHNRNQMTQNSGDEYLRLLLLCSVFLPLGACFSLDAALDLSTDPQLPAADEDDHKKAARKAANLDSAGSSRYRFFSGWTFAFMFQIVVLYTCTALLKTGDPWWNGQAVYYALSLDMYVTRLGLFVRQFTSLNAFLTWSTIIFEWIGPLLLVFPLHTEVVRLVTVLCFLALHMGFGSCLNLGLFMWIPQATMCALLPTLFWDQVMLRLRTPARRGLRIHYTREALLFVRIVGTFFLVPDTKMSPIDDTVRERRAEAFEYDEGGSLALAADDVEDPSARPSVVRGQWLIAVNHKGEAARGTDAVLCILAHSPLLFFVPPIVRLLCSLPGCSAFQGPRRVASALESCASARVPWRKRNRWRKAYSGWRQQWLAVLFVLFTLNWNASLEADRAYLNDPIVHVIASTLRLDQFWGMFAPFPLTEDGWWVFPLLTPPAVGLAPSVLRDGTQIDLIKYLHTGFHLTGHEEGDMVSFEKPEMIYDRFPSQRWSKLFDNLRSDSANLLRLGLGRYICREWNLNAGNPPERRLVTFDFIFMAEVTLPDHHTAPVEQLTLWQHEC